MRRPLLALSLAVVAFLVSACASADPGWTYAPPTPAPSATPVASDAGEPTPVPGASEEPASGAVKISAINVAFNEDEVSAPADADFVISFDNQDAGIPHNVEIKDSMNMSVFKGDIVTGPIAIDYDVPALPTGDYTFICTVHPNMVGNLKVGG